VPCLTVAVENVLELSDGRRDLQPEVEDLLLALETDVRGPSHHARQVALGLDVLANTEVLGALLEEGVLSSSEPAAVRMETFNVPWRSSWCRPCPEGRARAPLSWPWVPSYRRGCH
jgi:hypothetical protein